MLPFKQFFLLSQTRQEREADRCAPSRIAQIQVTVEYLRDTLRESNTFGFHRQLLDQGSKVGL
jgi:hypothetical protein